MYLLVKKTEERGTPESRMARPTSIKGRLVSKGLQLAYGIRKDGLTFFVMISLRSVHWKRIKDGSDGRVRWNGQDRHTMPVTNINGLFDCVLTFFGAGLIHTKPKARDEISAGKFDGGIKR